MSRGFTTPKPPRPRRRPKQRTARDASDEELMAIYVQVGPYLEARGGRADPTDAIVILAVIQEARERGLIE